MKVNLSSEKLERVFSHKFDNGLLFISGSSLVAILFLGGIYFDRIARISKERLSFIVILTLLVGWSGLFILKLRSEKRAKKVAAMIQTGRLRHETTTDGRVKLSAEAIRNFDIGAGPQRISTSITETVTLDELERLQAVCDLSARAMVLSLPGPVTTNEAASETEAGDTHN